MVSARSRRENGAFAETLTINLKQGESKINIVLEISYPRREGETAKAQVEILRADQAGQLPQGLGVAMYQKLLDLFPDLATRRGVTIIDEVKRNPMHMSYEQWHRLFDPVLIKHEYLRIDEGHWQKGYPPAKEHGSLQDFMVAP